MFRSITKDYLSNRSKIIKSGTITIIRMMMKDDEDDRRNYYSETGHRYYVTVSLSAAPFYAYNHSCRFFCVHHDRCDRKRRIIGSSSLVWVREDHNQRHVRNSHNFPQNHVFNGLIQCFFPPNFVISILSYPVKETSDDFMTST